jgi:hypothetical protein
VRFGTWIGIRRAADATRIQNQWAVGQSDQVLLVTVPAQNHTSLNISQSSSSMDVPERAVCDLLDKILIVIRGRAVTGEDAMPGISPGG